MKEIIKFVADNATVNGLGWNGKVYGNAIYLNGKKKVLEGEVLNFFQKGANAISALQNISADAENNVSHLDTEVFGKKVTIENFIDFLWENIFPEANISKMEFKKEVEESVLLLKATIINKLIEGINGLLTKEEKEKLFLKYISFVKGESDAR